MVTCVQCQHEELVGAVFCSECGARLGIEDITELETTVYSHLEHPLETSEANGASTVRPPFTETPFQSEAVSQPAVADPDLQEAPIALKIATSGKLIPLTSGDEFTLGRISGNQPILPDIDLTGYQAYEQGVSRLHATIRVMEDMITITDLDSANGTRLNRKVIQPHVPHPLRNGDILHLGKFQLQILIRKSSLLR